MNYLSKAIILLILCSVTVFFLNREEERGNFASVNRTYIDWLIGNSKKKIQEPSVTFLRIDEDALSIFESEAPLGPVDFALLFSKLETYDPKVTAVAPALAWKDTDELLLNTLKNGALKFDRLLLGAVLEQNPAGAPISYGVLTLFPDIANIEGEISSIPEFTGALSLPEVQLRITSHMGFTHIDLADVESDEEDSLKVPLLARHTSRRPVESAGGATEHVTREHVIPSLVLQAVLLEHGAEAGDIEVKLGKEIRIDDDLSIPIDHAGNLAVFTGLRERLPVHGADILIWNPDDEAKDEVAPGLKPEERRSLENRVVLIGYDDEKARRIPLKGDVLISRGELFALAIATIQSGRYIRKFSPGVQYAVWGLLLAAGLWLLKFPRRRAVGGSLLVLLLYFVAGMLLFQGTQSWMPLVVSLGLIACSLLGGLVLCSGAGGAREEEPEAAS